jgi:hypothetical protein
MDLQTGAALMYVERDSEGKIVAVYAREQQFRALEFVAADHPDIVEFLERGDA